MATRKKSQSLVPCSALILNGQRLEVTPERAEYTRLLKRFTELAVTQRAAAAETIDGFKDDVDSFCEDADEWAHKYIDTVADLAVEELVAKGCFDVDRSAFIADYLNTYLWDKRINSLRELVKDLNEEESERESRRQDRTESARHLFDDDYDDEKMMNLASAGVSGIFNAIGRSMASSEMARKISEKFEEDRDAYLRAIYLTIRTSVDELVSCLSDKGKCDANGGVAKEDREKADRLFNNLSGAKMPKETANKIKHEILQLDPYKQEFYDWCFQEDGDPSGELEKIADYFGVSLNEAKAGKFSEEVGECTYVSEEETLEFRKKVVSIAKALRYDAAVKLVEIDGKLAEFDRLARTIEGREFETREEAAKQRELADFEKALSIETEEEALSSLKRLKAKVKALNVNGAWKMSRVEEAVRRFDELARTVDGRVFETRAEAAKQRELSACESSQDLSTEEAAKQARENIVAKIDELKIDGSWKLERVDAALKKFDELARTTFGILFTTREEAEAARGKKELFCRGVTELAEHSGEEAFYFEGIIPGKKLANAQKCFPIPAGERVLCLTDTTLFGSGKTGLAITEFGLRWANGKSVASVRNSLGWDEFANLHKPPRRIQGDRMILCEGAVYANAGSNVDDDKMCSSLIELYAYCKSATFSFTNEGMPSREGLVKAAEKPVVVDMNTQSLDTLVEKLAEPLGACSEVFVGENIPPKKLANARKSMRIKEADDDVRLLVDATVFGSAKDGLVVTSRAIYFKNGFEDPVVIPWVKLNLVEVRDDGNLMINGKEFTTIGLEDQESKDLGALLNKIGEWIRARVQ